MCRHFHFGLAGSGFQVPPGFSDGTLPELPANRGPLYWGRAETKCCVFKVAPERGELWLVLVSEGFVHGHVLMLSYGCVRGFPICRNGRMYVVNGEFDNIPPSLDARISLYV